MSRTVTLPALALLTSCTGGLAAREHAVHDALAGVGVAEVGARSAASLDRGGHLQFPLAVEAGRCVAVVAVGGRGLDDVDVELLRQDGVRAARDGNVGATASARYCATSTDEVEVVVTAARGRGDVAVHVYDASGAGARPAGGGAAASCAGAELLAPGATVHGDTRMGGDVQSPPCADGHAPEVYYRIEVAVRSVARLDLRSSFDGTLYVQRTCGGDTLACNDDAGSTAQSHVDVELDPGEYVVVVDGYGNEAGDFELSYTLDPMVPVAQLCSEATPLVAGTPLRGTTVGANDNFATTCGGGGRSYDRVHALQVPARSRVRIVQETPDHDGVLFVRRSCEEEASEVACNDDFGSVARSVVTTLADPGTLFVYTDGFSNGVERPAGSYVLQAELGSPDGGGAVGDTCDAPRVAAGESIALDTFTAHDDYAASCGGQGGADVVRRFRLEARSRVRLDVSSAQFAGHVYVRRASCDGAEVACRSFEPSANDDATTPLDVTLDAGEYFLFVDGADVERFGSVNLALRLDDIAAMERVCRAAPALAFATDVRGSTAGGQNHYEASCAGSATSPDTVYRLVVGRRAYVTIDLRSEGYDGALHVRSSCGDPASELACNDDAVDGETGLARIERNFEPGTYFVVVDGYAGGSSGSFVLRAEQSAYRPGAVPNAPVSPREQPDDGGRLKPARR